MSDMATDTDVATSSSSSSILPKAQEYHVEDGEWTAQTALIRRSPGTERTKDVLYVLRFRDNARGDINQYNPNAAGRVQVEAYTNLVKGRCHVISCGGVVMYDINRLYDVSTGGEGSVVRSDNPCMRGYSHVPSWVCAKYLNYGSPDPIESDFTPTVAHIRAQIDEWRAWQLTQMCL